MARLSLPTRGVMRCVEFARVNMKLNFSLRRALLGLLLLFSVGLASGADPAYLLDGTKFVSKTCGFSMPVPQGWGAEPITRETHVPVRFARPTGRADALVMVLPNDSSETQLPSASELEKMSQKRFRGFQITKTTDTKLGGYPFRLYTATGSAGTRAYRVYAGVVGGQLFLVWMSSNQEAFSEAAAEFSQAMQQIEFQNVTTPEGSPTRSEG